MGFLAALTPEKNLALAIIGAFIVVCVELIFRNLFGINMAVEISQLLSTEADPVTPQTVLVGEASGIGYLIAHICDIIDKRNGVATTTKT